MKQNLNLGLLLVLASLFASTLKAQVITSLINQGSLSEPINQVSCTLENGTSTQCYQLKFFANDVDDSGPFCPLTISDTGGLAVYEPGASGTNVGLAALDSVLLSIIEADGFDIVQPNGTVNINDPGAGTGPPAMGTSYCLQAGKDDDLELVYLIPVTPENLSTPNQIQPVEQLGVSLNGIPFKGNPPGVLSGPGGGGSDVLMPALDPCGGHHDPGGYYHWHMIANSTNDVLDDLGITAVSCTKFPQDNSAIMGYAMDGYPIYGQFEEGATLPTNLDECNGHFAETSDYPSGVYHYHAVQGVAPNIPPCLKGASANNNFTYSFHINALGQEIIQNESSEHVYPNPSVGDLVKVETQAEQLALYDNQGRMPPTSCIRKVADGFEINTAALPNGIYHVVLIQEHSMVSKKLSVNH